MIELFIIPFLLDIFKNGLSNFLFNDINDIMIELYEKAKDKFNKKYKNLYGGKYNNFITKQENNDVIVKALMNYNVCPCIDKTSFDGEVTPNYIVNDFIHILNELIESDDRLTDYRVKKKHFDTANEVLCEVKKITSSKLMKFEKISSYLLKEEIPNFTIDKTSGEINDIVDKLLNNKIVHIVSYRGFGKSTTLLMAANIINRRELFDNVYYMHHGITNVLDSLKFEISCDENNLILIDNVDIVINDFVELMNYSKRYNIKILITSQNKSLEKIKNITTNNGMFTDYYCIDINNWKSSDYIQIMTYFKLNIDSNEKEFIASHYQSPAVINIICKNSTGHFDVNKIYSDIYHKLKIDIYDILSELLTENQICELIYFICCNVPIGIKDENFIREISTFINIPVEIINEAVQKLKTNGIIKQIGYELRFNPDLMGDIYLSYISDDEKYDNVLSHCINKDQEKVLRNIDFASKIKEININKKLLPIATNWTNSKFYFDRKENLKKSIYVVEIVPNYIINLIYTYMEDEKSNEDKYFKLTSDDFGPIINELWSIWGKYEDVLEIIRRIKEYNLEGTYSNYKVEELIRNVFSPINYKIEFIDKLFDILANWCDHDYKYSNELIIYGISEVLSVNHTKTLSTGNGIIFKTYYDIYDDALIKLRDKCINFIIDIIKNKLTSNNIRLLKDISHVLLYSDDLIDKKFSTEIIEERKKIIEQIGQTYLSNQNLYVRLILENILFQAWLRDVNCGIDIMFYLANTVNEPCYYLLKYAIDCNNTYADFNIIKETIDKQDKWTWYCENVWFNDKINNLDNVIEILNKKLTSENEIYCLFEELKNYLNDKDLYYKLFELLNCWYKSNPVIFKKYYESKYFDITFIPIKQNMLCSLLIFYNDLDSDYLINMIKDCIKYDDITILSIIRLLREDIYKEDDVIRVVNYVVQNEYLNNYFSLSGELYFIFKNRNKKYLVSILVEIIKDESKLNNFTYIGIILKDYINEIKTNEIYNELKLVIIDRLTNIEKIDWHIETVIDNITDNCDDALQFLKKRLMNEKLINKVPFEGFKFLNKYLKNNVNLKKIIYELIKLEQEEYIDSNDKRHFFNNIFYNKSDDGNLVIIDVLDEAINNNEKNIVIDILNYYELNESTLEKFVSAISYLNRIEENEMAYKILCKYTLPCGGWSRKIGENSKEKINTLKCYKGIYELLPYGSLKTKALECINYIEEDIKRDLIEDEAIINPR